MENKQEEYSQYQKLAFDKYKKGYNIFITGPGGSGKSKLIKDIKKHAIRNSKDVQVCALTGCAAVLLECKAKTLHSWAGIGLASGPNSIVLNKIMNSNFKKKIWKDIDILIIDEISMMSKKLFELLDLIGKTVRKNNLPFGGIQLVFSGDFYQLPPVGHKDDPETIQYCFESILWFETFYKENNIQLVTIFRQKDPVYANILNQIREGVLKKSSCKKLEQYVNRPFPKDFKPTKLFPTRNKVDIINQNEMSKLDKEIVEYKLKFLKDLPMTEKEKNIRNHYSQEQIDIEWNYLKSNLICEDKIQVKLGAQVMCIVNIELPNGQILCNGSQGIVTGFSDQKLPIVKFNNDNNNNINSFEILMNYHVWPSENIPGIGISQIPLILAWALTIHKAQGSSMDYAEIDVGNSIFESGQTYVALSRLKGLEGLYLSSFNPTRIRVSKKVKEFYDNLDLDSGIIDNSIVETNASIINIPIVTATLINSTNNYE
jgi:ATP-dependent DNA helicase PIF1